MIPESDLKVERIREDRGGQHTNGPDLSPIKVTHLPTGIYVVVPHSVDRSSHHVRGIAMNAIYGALTSPRLRFGGL